MTKHKVLAAVTLVTAVLVGGATVAPANAIGTRAAVYPDTVRTAIHITNAPSVKNAVKKHKRATVKIRVAASGNARPTGKVKVRVTGKRYHRTITARYVGSIKRVKLPRLKATAHGKKYTIKVTFKAPATSVYRNSSTSITVKAKKQN